MTTYHVSMRQAAIIRRLDQHWVSTGAPPNKNFLQSCSAVIMAHSGTGVGGLYHYPAGQFTGNAEALEIVDAMLRKINPTHAAVVHGGTATAMKRSGLPGSFVPEEIDGDEEIFAYLEKKLGPGHVEHSETGTGFVAARLERKKLVVTCSTDGLPILEELALDAAGEHTYGSILGESDAVKNVVY